MGSEVRTAEDRDPTPTRPASPAVLSLDKIPISIDPLGPPNPFLSPDRPSVQETASIDDGERTPPAMPREASILLDTPPPRSEAAEGTATLIDQPRTESDGGSTVGVVEDDHAAEKKETLKYVNDVFGDDPVIVCSSSFVRRDGADDGLSLI